MPYFFTLKCKTLKVPMTSARWMVEVAKKLPHFGECSPPFWQPAMACACAPDSSLQCFGFGVWHSVEPIATNYVRPRFSDRQKGTATLNGSELARVLIELLSDLISKWMHNHHSVQFVCSLSDGNEGRHKIQIRGRHLGCRWSDRLKPVAYNYRIYSVS